MNEQNPKKHEVRIHIDRVAYESPTPTTGAGLYALANVPHNKELFLESEGDEDDVAVPRSDAPIKLQADAHLYPVCSSA